MGGQATLFVDRRLAIPLGELQFTFARSSGPGGQNVNKVSSKAILRWAVATSASLPPPVRERFLARYRRRITAGGELILTSQRFRDAGRNVADCLEKLRALLAEVSRTPEVRKATRPTRGSNRRRLDRKRVHAEKKRSRGRGELS